MCQGSRFFPIVLLHAHSSSENQYEIICPDMIDRRLQAEEEDISDKKKWSTGWNVLLRTFLLLRTSQHIQRTRGNFQEFSPVNSYGGKLRGREKLGCPMLPRTKSDLRDFRISQPTWDRWQPWILNQSADCLCFINLLRPGLASVFITNYDPADRRQQSLLSTFPQSGASPTVWTVYQNIYNIFSKILLLLLFT